MERWLAPAVRRCGRTCTMSASPSRRCSPRTATPSVTTHRENLAFLRDASASVVVPNGNTDEYYYRSCTGNASPSWRRPSTPSAYLRILDLDHMTEAPRNESRTSAAANQTSRQIVARIVIPPLSPQTPTDSPTIGDCIRSGREPLRLSVNRERTGDRGHPTTDSRRRLSRGTGRVRRRAGILI